MSDLDTTFTALADPTRREILLQLRQGETKTLGALAEPFAMSLPGVMKHVAVLEDAGLLHREKVGRTVHCRLKNDPLDVARVWLEEMAEFWNARLDALADLVENDAGDAPNAVSRKACKGLGGARVKSKSKSKPKPKSKPRI